MFNAAEEIGKIAQERVPVFERFEDDTTRITFIGMNLKLHGDKWEKKNPDKMKWLEEVGETRESAIEKHNAWKAEKDKHPFWSEMRSARVAKKKKAEQEERERRAKRRPPQRRKPAKKE